MSEIDLDEKFPDMQPINGAPGMWTLNGCGTMLYGRRDFDEETRTYIKTLFITLLFIPLFALRSYRVANAQQGWYFIGRVPMLAWLKAFNGLVILALAGSVGGVYWYQHVNSPDYVAAEKVASADQLTEQEQYAKAAKLYGEVAAGNTIHKGTASQRFDSLIDKLEKAPVDECIEVIKVAVDLESKQVAIADLFSRTNDIARLHADKQPEKALVLLAAVEETVPAAKFHKTCQPLLELLTKKHPKDVGYASRLAAIYELQRNANKCKELLEPHRDRLEDSEGARILGQIYRQEGKLAEAEKLLSTYTEKRLKQLETATRLFENIRKSTDEAVIDEIKNNRAPKQIYSRLKATNDQFKAARIIREYANQKLAANPQFQAAKKSIQREARVTPVALDLGMVLLQRAQTQPKEKRRELLKKAEKTFLGVRSVAGDDAQYRLVLGQVYYWLGRHADGEKLFNEVLSQPGKNSPTFAKILVAKALREVGETTKARKLTEKAYETAETDTERFSAASFRALMFRDIEDKIAWLNRCDVRNTGVKADLQSALGAQAQMNGDHAKAADHYRHAIELWKEEPENATTLNNMGIEYMALYGASGEKAALDTCIELLTKSIKLQGSSSIILRNLASVQETSVLHEMLSDKIDLRTADLRASFRLLFQLFDDSASRVKIVDRYRNHPKLQQAISNYKRLLILSPKSTSAYSALLRLYEFFGDQEKLDELAKRLDEAKVDLTELRARTMDFYAGKDVEKQEKSVRGALKRLRETLPACRKKGGITLSALTSTLSSQLRVLDSLGEKIDRKEDVRLAEEGYQANKSQGSLGTLINALLARAHGRLVKTQPDYATMDQKARRVMSAQHLLALALERPDLRKVIVADPDAKRAVDLIKQQIKMLPEHAGEWRWAMLRHFDKDLGKQCAEMIKTDRIRAKARNIDRTLNPYNASYALDAYWANLAAGDQSAARATLRRAIADGIPLPVNVKE